MTAADIAIIVGAVSVLLGTIGTFVLGVLTLLVSRDTAVKVEAVHVATNSMKDELVAKTALASEAKGRDEERANPTGPPTGEATVIRAIEEHVIRTVETPPIKET